MWTPHYCPKFQPTEPVWGAGKQRPPGMHFPNRSRATTRIHLRMRFCGGKGS